MFNDKYGLTQAVLEGRKTQTRRLIKCRKTFKGEWVAGFNIHIRPSDKKVIGLPCMYDADEIEFEGGEILPKYMVGEVVAVAQSYDSFYNDECNPNLFPDGAGWTNKMYVKPKLMPNQILITDVRVERLQDISDEDCLKEGIEEFPTHSTANGKAYTFHGVNESYKTPRKAYASLIDKVSGKGTWESNPYVFVYDFELVK